MVTFFNFHSFIQQSPGDCVCVSESSSWITVFVVDEISLEGMVVHRAECRPVVNDNYMKLKKWVKILNHTDMLLFAKTGALNIANIL